MWEVEGETGRTLETGFVDTGSPIKNQDTNRAYSEANPSGNMPSEKSEQVNILPERKLPPEFRSHYSDKEEVRRILYNGSANIIIQCVYSIWRA